MKEQLKLTLSNGVEMPMAGIGTFLLTPDEAEASCLSALENGYRLIDTANAYVNERAVGRAMRKSGLDRKEIFLETKLWPAFYEQPDAVEKTLERLDTDCIDLLLIHQPAGNYVAGYRQMEAAVRAGKVRAIGLSNFNKEQIREILSIGKIRSVLLQTEVHPYFQEKSLKEFLASEGMAIQAWYPLGHGDQALLDDTDRLFQTHFWGPIALIKAVLPNMRARRSGAIINFSSIAGLRTSPGSGYYAAAKRAVEGMSEGLRAELAPLGIKVMVESCEALLRDPKDLRARENVMWASCVNTMGVFRSGVDAALEDAAIVEAGCSRLRALMEAGGVDTTLAPNGACPTMDYVKRSLAKEDYGEFTPEELHGMIAACCA